MATHHEGEIKGDEVDKALSYLHSSALPENKWDYLSSFVEKTRPKTYPHNCDQHCPYKLPYA